MEPERQEYQGHHIELREREGKPELLINNIPVRYGQLPNGSYCLHDYAYDWTDTLMELARRLVDYRRKADKIRLERDYEKGRKCHALPKELPRPYGRRARPLCSGTLPSTIRKCRNATPFTFKTEHPVNSSVLAVACSNTTGMTICSAIPCTRIKRRAKNILDFVASR